jgi:hypothetical protein
MARPGLECLEDRLVPSVTVNTTQDPTTPTAGVLSLREAIALVNAGQVADNTIVLNAGTHTNAQGALNVTHSLVLQGAGTGTTIIDGGGTDRVFLIDPAAAVNVQLSGVTVRNGNTQGFGGGIELVDVAGQSSVLTLTNCVVSQNVSASSGAGIYSLAGDVHLNACLVVNNQTTGTGGGVVVAFSGTGNLTVTDSTISGNQASAASAIGVFGGDPGNLTITRSAITGNTATGTFIGGAGISVNETGTVTIGDSTISTNTGPLDGGGILFWGHAPAGVTLSNDVIAGNSSTQGNGGGVAVNVNTTLTVTGCTITGNSAALSGGGISDTGNGALTISNSLLAANSAKGTTAGLGGALYDTGAGSTVTVTNSLFLNDSAAISGGGIYLTQDGLSITASQFSGDSATAGSAGAVFFTGNTLTVTASTFNNDQSGNKGGALLLSAANTATLTNDTLTANTTSLRGGAIQDFAALVLLNDTINANSAGGLGGGVNLEGTGTLSIQNTIIALNTAQTAGSDVHAGAGALTDKGGNFIGNLSGSTGFAATTLTGDPKLGALQNNGGPLAGAPGALQVVQTEALLAGSTAINAGLLSGAPAADERGLARDALPDIGAFEVVPLTVSIQAVTPAVRTTAVDTIAITFNQPVTGLTLANFQLLRDGVNLLSAAQTLTTTDNVTWTLGNLKGLTDPTHRVALFTLTLSPAGLAGPGGLTLAQGASTSFTEVDPTLSLQGRTLTFTGTPGNDTFTFAAGSPEVVSLDGVTYTVDPAAVDSVLFLGNGGTDVAVLTAAGTGNAATLSPGAGQLAGKGYSVSVSGVTDLYVYGGSADSATLADTLGGASFLGTPSYSYLKAGSLVSEVVGFGFTQANAKAGAQDTAYFYDSAGDDTFVGTPTYSYIATNGAAYAEAIGFQTALAFSLFGGKDTALLFAGAGNNLFVAAPTYAYLATGGVVYAQADGFQVVQAYSAGGNDTALFFDSPGHDVFVGTRAYSYLAGTGFLNQANGFATVDAYSTAGGSDTALLFDSPEDDTFVGQGAVGTLSAADYSISVQGFASVSASSTNGGHDHKVVGAIDYLFSAFGNWM